MSDAATGTADPPDRWKQNGKTLILKGEGKMRKRSIVRGLSLCSMAAAVLLWGASPVFAESKTYTNSIGMEFVLIPAGSFMMGTPPRTALRTILSQKKMNMRNAGSQYVSLKHHSTKLSYPNPFTWADTR
ncbi:MAG: hypothetical protein AB7S75_21635 [Desulfococcaceae bacterium]